MDATVIAAIGGGLTGLGSFAALLGVFTKARADKRQNDTTAAGLASTLNSTAQDWINYIDGKFNEVSEELKCVNSDFTSFKADTVARDSARAVLHQAHRVWDFAMKDKLEGVTGDRIADPPPLDLPDDLRT